MAQYNRTTGTYTYEGQGGQTVASPAANYPVGATPGTAFNVNKGVATTPIATPVAPTPTVNPVNTGQPSPTSVNAQPYTGGSIVDALSQGGMPSDFASRAKMAATAGIPDYKGTANQNTQLLQKYKTGLLNAQASGTPPPANGEGGNVISPFVPPTPTPPPDTSVLDLQLANDPDYQQLLNDKKEYDNVVNQTKSLVDEYKSMIAEAGIPAINTELINTKNIIDGTEDDIRTEVTKAGGFATDSQVLAMSNARNKTLIKNYNNLLDTKQMAMESINTMVGLASQDRQNALASITAKLNIDSKIIEYKDKMKTNAAASYQKIVDAVGYDGLMKSTNGDPYYVNLVEKTMGMTPGQLKTLASQPNIDRQIKEATLTGKRLENQKLTKEISNLNNPLGTPLNTEGKPLTPAQNTALSFGVRLVKSNQIANTLDEKFAKTPRAGLTLFGTDLTPNIVKSKDRQIYEQAILDFINAKLRQESGAAIGDPEYQKAEKQYFAQYGDSPLVLAQKKANRNLVTANQLREGGQGYVNIDKLVVNPETGELMELTN